ncbi:hypothetical protein PINS_up009351 [Pythium insidiosum]|nr:hypothetical protein PINS_up009351 [Pythium insidiosum]
MVPTQLVLALVACVPRISDADLAAATDAQAASLTPPAELGRRPSAIGFALNLLTSLRVPATVLAEALVVLAEELSDVQTRGVRERMLRELDAWAPRVLDELLPQLMQDAVQASQSAAQEMVLRAARAWIRYARVPAEGVVRNALVQSLLVFVRHDELFDAAVDLVVELVRRYGRHCGRTRRSSSGSCRSSWSCVATLRAPRVTKTRMRASGSAVCLPRWASPTWTCWSATSR